MFGDWYNGGILYHQLIQIHPLWQDMLCILLTGMSIKLMDDWLDYEYDECIGKFTLARKLGKATLPYTLLILVIASVLHAQLALGLFLGSYAAGMAFQFRDRMPTGLPGYVEAGIAVVIGGFLIGIPLIGFSVLMMICVQFLDDILDLQKDRNSGQRNLAAKFGMVEATLLFLTLFVACILLNAVYTSIVMIVLPLITVVMEWRKTS